MSNENEKPAKPEKPVKIPGAFKKPIKEHVFEKKYLKQIEQPTDKTFLLSCFVLKDETYVIRDNLKKDDIKKLKVLIKASKENRKGTIKFIPLIIISSFIAAIAIFFIVFANPLLEKAMELGLEAVFEAKADVDNFRLSLIKFEISTTGITVANKDSPMTNLFQMSKTGIKLKPQALLRGKVYIEWIKAETIRFGTPRKVSGTLNRPPREKPPKPVNDAPPLVDLANFDAMALLNQEFDKLSSPKLYDEAIKSYNEAAEKWPQEVENASARVTELRTSSAPLMNLNVSAMRDPEAIRKSIQDITTMINTVQAATNDVTRIVSGIEADINTARRLETNARNAVSSDLNHLKSYIDIGSGSAFDALEPFIRDMLSDTANQYFDYGLIALDALDKLKAMSAAKPKDEKPAKARKISFKGRNVTYPVRSFPAFYLGEMSSDFTLNPWNWSFNLQNVSSDPDWHGSRTRPVELKLGLREDAGRLQRTVGFNGSADFRSDTSERFKADVNAQNFPISIGNQFSNAGINGFKGDTDFSVNMTGLVGGKIEAGGNILINNSELIDPRGTLAQAVGSAIEEAGTVRLGIQYENNSLKINTNIADLVSQAIRRTAEVYARRAMADLERALQQKIASHIDGRFASKDQLDSLLRVARGDKAAIDQVSGALNSKRRELEQQIQSAAQQAGQQAIREALPGNLPRLR